VVFVKDVKHPSVECVSAVHNQTARQYAIMHQAYLLKPQVIAIINYNYVIRACFITDLCNICVIRNNFFSKYCTSQYSMYLCMLRLGTIPLILEEKLREVESGM